MTEADNIHTVRRLTLKYGHPGEAVYKPDSQAWQFARPLGDVRHFDPLGQATCIVEPSLDFDGLAQSRSAASRAQNIKRLTNQYPEVEPAVSFLLPLEQVSEAVANVTSIHDPVVSDLLAFGNIAEVDNEHSGDWPIPIVAVASGRAGEAVKFLRLCHDVSVSKSHQAPTFGTQGLLHEDTGWLVGTGGPIQQLRFGAANGLSGPWLAVRCLDTTAILRPALRRAAVPSSILCSQVDERLYPASRLDANVLITLPAARTGGTPHADVTFNPWNSRQFAIVDQKGSCNIWNINEHRRRKHRQNPTINLVAQGYRKSTNHHAQFRSSTGGDGWRAILWAYNANTILIADRLSLIVANIGDTESGNMDEEMECDLGLPKSLDWILDIQRDILDDAQLYVATSSSILILYLGETQSANINDPSKIGMEIRLCWKHFRDSLDISLRFSITSDEEVLVALYSRMSSLCTAFAIRKSKSIAGMIQSTTNHFKVSLPPSGIRDRPIESARPEALFKHISALVILPIKREAQGHLNSTGPGVSFLNQADKFFQAFVLYNDLSIWSDIYCMTPSAKTPHIQSPNLRMSRKLQPSSSRDEVTVDTESESEFGDSRPYSNLGEDPLTVNMEWLYADITN